MRGIIKSNLFLLMLVWSNFCIGFSATYFYELYLHNEYYAEPPGFPSKIVGAPLIAFFTGKGDEWHEKRFTAALVEAVRLAHDHSWVEFIAGFGKERVKYNHEGVLGEESRFGLDDFLIDIGHNFLDETEKKQLLLHWLIGIPLKWGVTPAEVEEPLFGTRTFATGPVIELAYDFIRNRAEDLFVGFIGRFLHRFFKRSYEPILPAGAILNPGNAIDLLAMIHYRYYGHNLEIGYVPTFYFNISYQFPSYTEHLPSQRYHTIYGEYYYFSEPLSMGFEIGIAQTFGKPYEGTTLFGLIEWYF